ncbi:MAG: hypothetical protein M1835_004506 [Candelina submexicana]|nr:MAG: hypothetical protein M1835_004506 [Candelina submexicana]
MSSRRPRPSASTSTRTPTPLPPYEPPTHALNPTAQRALATLPQTHSLRSLKQHLNNANSALTEMAGEVNDRLVRRQELRKRRRARRAAPEGEDVVEDDEEESERSVKKMGEKVEKLTSEMEKGTRKIIDAQVEMQGVEDALREIAGNVMTGSQGVGGTQASGRSQASRSRRRRREDEDEGDEESEFEDMDESQVEGGSSEEIVAPSKMFSQKLTEQKAKYQALSMKARYATNNEYIGFKRIVHDSRHPGEGGPPLAAASTWFPDDTTTSSTSPSTNTAASSRRARQQPTTTTGTAEDDNDDDEIAIASERISTKCPITLQDFKEPVTSKKCPHSFEKSAILSLINDSGMRSGGPRGEKAVKCPVCEMLLTPSDLTHDKVLTRRIKRLLLAARDESDSDIETPHHSFNHQQSAKHHHQHSNKRGGIEEIDDDDDDDDIDNGGAGAGAAGAAGVKKRARSLAPTIKAERKGRAGLAFDPIVSTQGSVVVDLGDGDDGDNE